MLDDTEQEPTEAVKDRAYPLIERAEAALEAGEIDEAEWHRQIGEVITPAYLAADTPWGQSGRSGDERQWTYARSLVCDAIERDGTFLDVGCANGYLMESIERWSAERGHRIEPYGTRHRARAGRSCADSAADVGRPNLHRQRDDLVAASAVRFCSNWPRICTASSPARPGPATSRRLRGNQRSSDYRHV